MREELKRRCLEYSLSNLKVLICDPEYHKTFHEEYDKRYGKS
jgi:hypothetical protein